MRTPKQIIIEAIQTYKPISALLMFSGGHDSLTSTHISAEILTELGLPFSVYHGDTGTGIQATQDFVKMVCNRFGWDLVIRKPEAPYDYEGIIKKFGGFPGPAMHPVVMRNLKEKPLRKYITHTLKSSPYARENVLLLTGIRKSESVIRMGYKETATKDASRIWCSPIFHFSKDNCLDRMEAYDLPRNPVKDKICISGECLCGCFAKKEESAEIAAAYPEAWERLQSFAHLSPWKWGQNPKEFIKHNPPGQIDMFTNEVVYMPMCVGCESKNKESA